MLHKILKLSEVIDVTGLSRSTIYHRMKNGDFPCSIPLGERSVGWSEEEIRLWIESRIAQRSGSWVRRT